MAQALGPWAVAKRAPWPPGSALTTKLISPWRYSVTALERWRPTARKPMRSNKACKSATLGAVYSTNSKPSVPMGLSHNSIGVSCVAEYSFICNYSVQDGCPHDHPCRSPAGGRRRLDRATRLGRLHNVGTCGL